MKKNKIKPLAGQESVWDYPRPPRLEPFSKNIRIVHAGITLVNTNQAYRVLETSHPPVYYIPPSDIDMEQLVQQDGRQSFCEFKGRAQYWNIITPKHSSPMAAWSYPNPNKAFLPIAGYLAFYPSRVEACYVHDEMVQAQEGDFYGGWITSNIVGPFKGGPGTWGW